MNTLSEEQESTQFYKESILERIKKRLWLVILIVVTACIVFIWAGISAKARAALSHAKDIRVALKLVSIEYYGTNRTLYDASSETGLTDGALERIKTLTPVDGELTLTAWDDENNIPLSFTYREGLYLVEYKELGSGDGRYGMNGDWIVYYNFRIMELKAGE